MLAVLMATAVHPGNTDSIARCGMSRATSEATGCRHRATTRSISPKRSRATDKHTTINKCTLKGGRIDGHGNALVWYREHRPMEEVKGFVNATKHHHRASIEANRRQ
jgi:hypothetical protein